jgi:aryl-alcohol dehydrogenase-like predicted oxidoreductase
MRLLDAFVDAGMDFVDTADVYSKWVPGNQGGESEAIIGKWFKEGRKRQKIVLGTKVGMELGKDQKGLKRDYIFREVEQSLRRLQTDYIDLYQAHIDDAETPLDETLTAFDDLIKQGKVRALGASNYSGARLEEAIEVSRDKGLHRYEVLQPEYNLYVREHYEEELQPVCERNGLGVIPYFSLASGFLTGKYRSKNDLEGRARGSGVEKYMDERGMRILSALDDVSSQYQSKPARVALAWLMARPSITAPIASATSEAQLQDLVEATRLHLGPEAIEKLDHASSYEHSAAAGS